MTITPLGAHTDQTGVPPPPAGWPTLGPDALYGLAGEVVRTLEPHTEADPAGLLADFLTSFGNCVGAGPHIDADGAHHPARLNVALVGQTSKARKGTSRAQIQRLYLGADGEWAQHRVMGGLASGEGLIAAVQDPTTDDDGREVGGSRDRRLMVVEPELARVLTVAGRDSSTLSPIIRDCWDTGNLRVLTRRDPLVATGAHVSIIGHITAEELGRKLSEVEVANGFANRFLLVCVRRSKLLPDGGDLPNADFMRLLRLIRTALEQARRVGTVTRTDDANDLWREMYADLADNDPSGLLGAVTARSEAQLLRVSLAYGLLDGIGRVGVDHLRAAWALLGYCNASAEYLFGDAVGDEIADRILKALKEAHPEGVDGQRIHGLFTRNVSAKRIEHARGLLISRGLARTEKEATGGRPREVTYLVTNKTKKVSYGRED